MRKKNMAKILIFLLFVTQLAYGFGSTPRAEAAQIDQDRNIITSVSMAVYDKNGNTVTDAVYEQGSKVQLDYTWELPSTPKYQSGDTYTFKLPDAFKMYNDVQGPLTFEGISVGNFTAIAATHEVVMTFNNYMETHDPVHGTLTLQTEFDKQVIVGSSEQTVVFPFNGGNCNVTLFFKPAIYIAIPVHFSNKASQVS